MSPPVNARVRAVPDFERLQAELTKGRSLLMFAPARGRPARFLQPRTGWGRFQSQQALRLARQLGMPGLREFVLAHQVVLYAHSEREVLLLAMRHEREVGLPAT